MRVATLNLWGRNGAWPERRAVLRDGFARLRPDVVAFQEAVQLDGYDQVLDLLGPDFHIVHQAYVDAWDFARPGEPGLTYTPTNPLVMEDSPVTVEEPRRVDYVFVRAGASGPTLRIDACERLFDEPVDGVWGSDHFGVVADLAPFASADG